MSTNKKPFWETNLNPITMFATSIPQPKRVEYCAKKKGSSIKTSDLDAYVSAVSLRKEYNIDGRKLKDLFASIGTPPRYYYSSTYYSTEHIEKARELLSAKKEVAVIDIEKYISNQELMDMFGFNTNKAHYIALNSRLVKFRFSGNINYYEREKAIATFTKHNR